MEKITQDFKKGVDQVLRSFEIQIHGGKPITQEDIDTERNHWNSQPIHAPTQSEIERFDIASKAAQTRELNKSLKEVDATVASIKAGIEALPSSFVNLAEKLSSLK